MRFQRTIAVLFGAVVLPTAASAGPIIDPIGAINFTYQSTSSTTPGSPNPGLVTPSPLAGGPVSFGLFGGSFTMGYITFGASPGPVGTSPYTASTGFHLNIAIQDTPSGQSGSLALDGTAVDSWTAATPGGSLANTSHVLELGNATGNNSFDTTAVIGGNTYSLDVTPTNSRTSATLTLGVHPNSDPTGAPEPGTLLLGMVGLVPFGYRAARRRATK